MATTDTTTIPATPTKTMPVNTTTQLDYCVYPQHYNYYHYDDENEHLASYHSSQAKRISKHEHFKPALGRREHTMHIQGWTEKGMPTFEAAALSVL